MLKFKVYKEPSEILTVVLYTMVERFYVRLLKKALNFFAKLPATLARYYFHFTYLTLYRFFKRIVQRFIYRFAVVENIV